MRPVCALPWRRDSFIDDRPKKRLCGKDGRACTCQPPAKEVGAAVVPQEKFATVSDMTTRMDAYRRTIKCNAANFAGKVALCLGNGASVLAVLVARAGAARVYAVEAEEDAAEAELFNARNGLGDVVTVIEGTIEEADLPE